MGKKFEYQLIEWQPTREMAEKFLDTFKRHRKLDEVVVRKSADGYALFTDGGLRVGVTD